MAAPDLQGPYDEFLERLNDIRRIVATVEACYHQTGALTTTRPNIDLTLVGPTTSNNSNAMALVFLASSYEEFVRQEITECVGLLATKYPGLPAAVRHSIRDQYWKTTIQRLGSIRGILTKSKPHAPDAAALSKVKPINEVAQLFVVNDDASRFEPTTAFHHSNNFRPRVVDEIGRRIGIDNLTARTAEGSRIKTYFGVATAPAAATHLQSKLDDFYTRRNEIVHSLSSTSGYAVDVVLDWISFFDAVADSMKDTLGRIVSTW